MLELCKLVEGSEFQLDLTEDLCWFFGSFPQLLQYRSDPIRTTSKHDECIEFLTDRKARTCRSKEMFFAFKENELYEFSHSFDGVKRKKKLEGGLTLPEDRSKYMSVCIGEHIMQIITKTDGSFEGCHFIDYGTLRASQDHPH
jgi:hypothetical protein